MDLFDNNPYYDVALPVPEFEPTFRSYERSYQIQPNNKFINWTHLEPVNCLLYQNHTEYQHFKQEKSNEGMLAVYRTPISQQEFNQLTDVKQFKRQKIIGRNPSIINFPKNFDKAFEELDRVYNLELQLQRGVNPFLHLPNYATPITVYGVFSSVNNLTKIVNIIEQQFIPNKIIIHAQLSNGQIDKSYKGKYNNIQLLGENCHEKIQIIYLKLNEKLKTGDILWKLLKLILKQMDEGGCFVFEIINLADPIITQFLYLFQKIFLLISMDYNDILTLSIKICCFGFQRSKCINLLEKIISNEESIITNNFSIFRTRELTQDTKFEQEVVQFYKFYLQKVSQQIKLISHFNDGGSINYNEFIQECKKLKEIAEEKKKKFNGGDRQYQNKDTKKDNTYRATQTKVINQKKQVEAVSLGIQPYIPKKVVTKSNKDKQKNEQKESEQEIAKQKLQKLLEFNAPKKKSNREELQELYDEKLGVNQKKKDYKTTANDRRKRHQN